MNNDSVSSIILLIIIAVGAIYFFQKQKEKLRLLKEEYNTALRGKDKKRALEAGRNYYSAMRHNKKLTIYDEQAITNDLATMDAVRRNS
jgi:hypothetical protein